MFTNLRSRYAEVRALVSRVVTSSSLATVRFQKGVLATMSITRYARTQDVAGLREGAETNGVGLLRRLILAAALFAAPAALAAQPVTFIGPVRDYLYSGCIDTRACFLFTFSIGEIAPTAIMGRSIPTTQGASFKFESWYFERGYSVAPLGSISLKPWGPAAQWEDSGYGSRCHSSIATCLGYAVDYGFTSSSATVPGAWAIYPEFIPTQEFPFMTFAHFGNVVQGQGFVESSTGSVRLTLAPEPSTWALFGVGLLAIGVAANRRRRA